MTAQEIIERCDKSIYQIWLEMAMRHYDSRDPEHSFVIAESFIKELFQQQPKFE